MRTVTRLLTLSLAAVFFTGCWGDSIAIRSANDADHIPFASKGKEEKALLVRLGKAPEGAMAPAAHGEGHEGAAPRAAETGHAPAEQVPAGD